MRRRIRKAGRYLGWGLLVAALLAFGGGLQGAIAGGSFQAFGLGELWYHLDAGSLNALQAFIQRYLFPVIWELGFTPVLLLPAWVVFGTVGGTLSWFLRRR
ncbi:MAG: hypothetical protein COA65_02440 [Rhodospirillaceae bacterium]|nr:MAG: hypothetical protein COA65_02440 [Rhodospirillaceae bacterium]